MPVSARESLQPPHGHAVQDVAMEEPLEERDEEMHPEKDQDERPCTRSHVARPDFREPGAKRKEEKGELKCDENHESGDGEAASRFGHAVTPWLRRSVRIRSGLVPRASVRACRNVLGRPWP